MQDLVLVSAAAAKANDAGCMNVAAGSHCAPRINVGHVNKRKRGRGVRATS
jgi:hypothetical protein